MRDRGNHITRVASVDWYYELRGEGPPVVLVPSGEGDCGSFEKVASALAQDFTVLTFDMPGFSRSSDPRNFDSYSLRQAAEEIAELVRSFELGPATFYGCSSGGQIGLWLAIAHDDVVRSVAVHEVPLSVRAAVGSLATLPEPQIIQMCRDLFRNQMNENPDAWDALGDAYHGRLERNYVTWMRRYVAPAGVLHQFTADELRGRRVTWTIGGLTPAAHFFDNVVLAVSAGIPISVLPCRHFPQVSIPDQLADHIRNVAYGFPAV